MKFRFATFVVTTAALVSLNTVPAANAANATVAYALDRADIITAEGGYATPYYTFIPPEYLEEIASHAQVQALHNSLPLYSYNLAKAKQEMAESAYPHGFSAPLVVFVYGTVVNTGEAIAGELHKIGIDLQAKAVTLNAWGSEISDAPSQRPTTYFTTGCTSPDPSGYDWLLGSQNLKIGEDNVADYAPPAVDALVNEGLAASTSAQRFLVYSKLLQTLGTDVPYIPLFLHDDCIALSSKFTFPGFNAYFNGVYGNLALGMLDIRPAQ
jgi:peptide/nickel transport system substrate-binding protein